jgi:hypothetical protein
MRFLINTFTHWNEPPRARHHVARALSTTHEVVFVSANQFGIPAIKTIVDGNIKVVIPSFPIINKIRYRLPFVNELYQKWLFKRLVSSYGNYQVINFDFTATRIFNYFKHVIYYCNDSFVAISRHLNPAFIARYHEKCESQTASGSVFCIAVSAILRDNLARYNPKSFEIPLGSPDMANYDIRVQEKKDHSIIHAGVMGVIRNYNISTDALNCILEDESINITLIGPVEDQLLSRINRKDKISLTGTLTGSMLYEEINKLDVTLAPYSSRLTSDAKSGVGTGSKIYHYFAMGKPVVISNMAGLKNVSFPDKFLYIADNDNDFPQLIHKAHNDNSDDLIRQRASYARQNSWQSRMEDLMQYINKYIES